MSKSVTVLAGGVGGARMAQGFYHSLAPRKLSVIVNTADDCQMFGLNICPDLDTNLYTLAGQANEQTGWGLDGDTFHCLEQIGYLDGYDWFRLGDRDLATHMVRTQMLIEGHTLTEVCQHLAASFGVTAQLLPMTNQTVATKLTTAESVLDFQEYFVKLRQGPKVQALDFIGAPQASVTPEVSKALQQADLIVVAPSNPLVSIEPMLQIPGFRKLLKDSTARIAAVSPVIGTKALKGPLASMMQALGHEVSPLGVARIYHGLIDSFVIDTSDSAYKPLIENELGVEVVCHPIVIAEPFASQELAKLILAEFT